MPTFDCAAILFDLDGVLVDSTASVGRVWKAWAEQHGLDPDYVISTAHGRRSIETIRLCAPHIDAEAAVRIVEQLEIDDTLDLAVINGAPELLSAIPAGKWAVVTSGTRALATSRMKAANLPTPSILVTANEVREGKPHPEPYLKAAELMALPPSECLVVEDTPAGIQAAHAAGMKVIALTTTYSPDVVREGDAVVRHLGDVSVSARDGKLRVMASEQLASAAKE